MSLLDRYVLRNFLEPFLICFFGFFAIWLVFDLSDNGQDFIEAHASLKQVAAFYATQLPQFVLVSMPVGVLLALLFSLSRMSRSNEIISMLTAGRSLPRVLLPLFIAGLLLSGACLWLNHRLAPHAEAIKKIALENITKGKKAKDRDTLEAHLFTDRQNNRKWFVRKMKPGEPSLGGVEVTQQDADGNIVAKWYADGAVYDSRSGVWTLNKGRADEFDTDGKITKTDLFPEDFRKMSEWSETPLRIASSRLEAQNLAVPELRDYLRDNADFPPLQLAPFHTYLHYRRALPWQCLVAVLIAAPLGVVFNRRGILAGVAGSIFIFFGMILLTELSLALGKGARLSPLAAAWLPNAVFAAIGLLLLWFRSTNRDLPRLFRS